jgi:DNA-binding CsgD family transcriptional regulator
MSKSMRLRISEVKAAFNLIGECRELWNTPPAWRVHLLRGLTELTGLAVGHYAEVDASSFAGPIQFLAAVDFGWRDEAARNYYLRYTADLTGACTAPMPGIDILARRLGEAGRAIAYRPELCSDSQWYRSAAVNEYRRPAFNDGYVLSFVRGQNNLCTHLGVHQDTSQRAPTLHAKRLVSLVHQQIAPMVGSVLAMDNQHNRQGLSSRLQQVLDQLLKGDSEKKIARDLKLRPPTVHEYIGKIYRHFAINSHAELLAYFLAQRPKMKCNDAPSDAPRRRGG